MDLGATELTLLPPFVSLPGCKGKGLKKARALPIWALGRSGLPAAADPARISCSTQLGAQIGPDPVQALKMRVSCAQAYSQPTGGYERRSMAAGGR